MYVIGKTGMGKTTLLLNIAYNDVLASEGVGFIDPHEDAANKLLQNIPKSRATDVICFNPADNYNPRSRTSLPLKHVVKRRWS